MNRTIIVYKGGCSYTGNYWNVGECVKGSIYYDKEGLFWVATTFGKKFGEDKQGMSCHIMYECWEDVLADWILSDYVEAQNYEQDTDINIKKDLKGNCYLDEITGCSIVPIVVNNKIGLDVIGYKDGVPNRVFVEI